jgi:C terminal of Calcineurin-like phosphoesterase
MHIPLRNYLDPDDPSTNVADRAKFLALLERRKAVSFSGHTHTTEHHYFGATEGFLDSTPHHHHVLTAVSGSWWSGPLDRRGIASADSRDGTPHGFHIFSIDHGGYTTNFIPANKPNGRQMRISLDANFHFGTDVFRDFRTGQLGARRSAKTSWPRLRLSSMSSTADQKPRSHIRSARMPRYR